jgi:hypothetical protein
MWMQIVGKVRLGLSPFLNHWWHVPFYVTPRGLTTSAMPHGSRTFAIDFDLVAHELVVAVSDGRRTTLPLHPQTVADFYRDLMATLRSLELEVHLWPVPVEIATPIPFAEDRVHASYDREQAHRFFQILARADQAWKRFRSRFVGKSSPVQFFWGSFDLAFSVYSGRPAPPHPDIPGVPSYITGESYSHEEHASGFWPGDERMPEPVLYAYAYPEPPGYPQAAVRPAGAYYSTELRESLLPYRVMRASPRPEAALEDFLVSSYEATARLGGWDRAALERAPQGEPARSREGEGEHAGSPLPAP